MKNIIETQECPYGCGSHKLILVEIENELEENTSWLSFKCEKCKKIDMLLFRPMTLKDILYSANRMGI